MADEDPDPTGAETENDEVTAATHGTTPYKVLGEIEDPSGTGVLGHNTATTGATRGVLGVADSDDNEAHALRGEIPGKAGKGVKGVNLTDPANEQFFGVPAAVYGQIDRGFGYGIIGYNGGTSSAGAYGVLGQTESSSGAGVWGYNPGGVGVKTTGYQEVSRVTLSVYLSTTQTVSNGTSTVVGFDGVESNEFPGSAFDPATGKFTVPIAGNYHVSAGTGWDTNFSEGDRLFCQIHVNSATEAKNYRTSGAGVSPNLQCSKTLVDLTAGDVVDVRVIQGSGGSADLATGQPETYVTIDKIA